MGDRNNFGKFDFFFRKKCIIHSESIDMSVILLTHDFKISWAGTNLRGRVLVTNFLYGIQEL